MSKSDYDLLRSALASGGDLELRFHCGRSICVHSLKLSLASSVLRDLMHDVVDEQIAAAKLLGKRRRDEGDMDQPMPHLQVTASHDGMRT